jgi:hypothetical protein
MIVRALQTTLESRLFKGKAILLSAKAKSLIDSNLAVMAATNDRVAAAGSRTIL